MNNPFELIEARLNNIEALLLDIKHNPLQPEQHESDILLTIQEAAKFLNLSVATLYGYVHQSEIPVSKKRKRLYFSKQELLEWIKTGRKKTVSEIETEANHYLQRNKKR